VGLDGLDADDARNRPAGSMIEMPTAARSKTARQWGSLNSSDGSGGRSPRVTRET